ncbi:MAG: hypothetical protein IJ565_04495 [Bacilli bacterium]|nr:hypothetical protein [Bacilli bacterium]
MKNKIMMYELMPYFLYNIYDQLLNDETIPPLKFIFSDKCFDDLRKYNIDVRYIKANNELKDGEYPIYINNVTLFFEKLTELVNIYEDNLRKYEDEEDRTLLFETFLNSGLWLRMTPYDFLDVYSFLDKQISFFKNDHIFDELILKGDGYSKDNLVSNYMGYNVYAIKTNNSIWCETNTRILFNLISGDRVYNMPSILYGIDDDTCYIYAVQNINVCKKDKKIERSLYKLNKDINNIDVYPSFVLSLRLFIDMLKSKNINKIKVPLLEVLNYEYHIRLATKSIEMYKHGEVEKSWLNRICGKEDFISKSKVDKLCLLFERIQNQYDDIELNIDDYMLEVKIKNKELKM